MREQNIVDRRRRRLRCSGIPGPGSRNDLTVINIICTLSLLRVSRSVCSISYNNMLVLPRTLYYYIACACIAYRVTDAFSTGIIPWSWFCTASRPLR